jgi:hypothetical protein
MMRNMMALSMFMLLALVQIASAQPFSGGGVAPTTEVITWVGVFMQVLLPLMLAFVAVALVVYMAGQMLGAETRARATVWSHGVLVAVGISALIIVMVNWLLPGFFRGESYDINVFEEIIRLRDLAASSLVVLTVILLVFAAAMYAIGMISGVETRSRAIAWSNGMLAGAVFAGVLYVVLGQIIPGLEGLFSGTVIGLYGSSIINIVFFMAFLILITYLISKVFKVPEWEAYLNIEFSNLISAFLLVLFVMGMFAVGGEVAMSFTDGTYKTPPLAVIGYMQSVVMDSALKATLDVYKIQACTSILSTFSKRIGEFVLTQTFKIFPGLDTFVSITNVLSFALLSLYSTIKAQVSLMYLFDAFVVPFVLPAGLVLRFFPPTRDAGAFLISVAFGFYVVFPATYLINAKIFDEIGGKPYNDVAERPTATINWLCGMSYGIAGFAFNPAANPLYSMIPGGQTIGLVLSRLVSEGLINALNMSIFIPIMKHVGNLSLLALFMPALSMMVTIAFINSMTKFIVSKV